MIAWNIFNGMVHNLPYKEIGQAVADGLNGAVSRFSLSEIGDTLATGLNGAFTSLYSFTERFDWSELVNITLPVVSTPLYRNLTGKRMDVSWKPFWTICADP